MRQGLLQNMIKENDLGSEHINGPADAHPAEGQFSHEKQALNKA
jgi:hypothetical protein